MCKAKAMRSSWEFVVVVGLNLLFFFLFLTHNLSQGSRSQWLQWWV